MTKYRIEKNPNEKFYEKISEAVEKNGFHCPCLLAKDEETLDTICCCKDFREMQIPEGETEVYCHCKRFKKVKVEE